MTVHPRTRRFPYDLKTPPNAARQPPATCYPGNLLSGRPGADIAKLPVLHGDALRTPGRGSSTASPERLRIPGGESMEANLAEVKAKPLACRIIKSCGDVPGREVSSATFFSSRAEFYPAHLSESLQLRVLLHLREKGLRSWRDGARIVSEAIRLSLTS
jgi:hypothetical protein